jgi:1-acyl-sn-glycerol-3-phosphate acyltransferase
VRLSFGDALRAEDGETANRFTRRLERAVAVLLDEQRSDWWSALRRQQTDQTPDRRGPEAADWRRRWELLEPDPPPARRPVWPTRRTR